MTTKEELAKLESHLRDKVTWCESRAEELDPDIHPLNYSNFRRMEDVYTDILLRVGAIRLWAEEE